MKGKKKNGSTLTLAKSLRRGLTPTLALPRPEGEGIFERGRFFKMVSKF